MPEHMYASNYLNVYASHRNTSILFNGFSGCIDEVSTDLGRYLSSRVYKKQPLSEDVIDQCSKSTIRYLLKRGHLTTLNREEEIDRFCKHAEAIDQASAEERKREGSLMLVPSYNCNLACTYCYQSTLRSDCGTTNRIMTKEQIDRLFENTIDQLFPDVTSKARVSIVLYGGEPFLTIHEKALRQITHYTIMHQMDVTAITNGTQLHHMLDLFGNKTGLVNEVQISLDGNKEIHDTTRVGHHSQPTFETIVDNMHNLINRRVRIGLRLNIDKHSVTTIPTLVERLKKEGVLGNPLVRPYAWVVHSHFSQVSEENLLTPITLAEYMEEHQIKIETPVGRRERSLRHVFNAKRGVPLRRTAYCMRCVPNAYVYDAYDNIYGCYEEAGHLEKRVGCIGADGGLLLNDLHRQGIKRHVHCIAKCKECSVALTCGGGCPFAASQQTGDIYSPDCNSHKECVEKAIQNLFHHHIDKKDDFVVESEAETLFPFA